MEKTALKKISKASADNFLDRMAQNSRRVIHTEVGPDGQVSQLSAPTVLRTPEATPTGEVRRPDQPAVRVELNAAHPVAISDLADKSLATARRREAPSAGGSGTKKPSGPAKDKAPTRQRAPVAPSAPTSRRTTSRPQERSSSPEDRTRDLVPRRRAGKDPIVVAEALGVSPSPRLEMVAKSLEDLAVEAGAREEPFSEVAYCAALTAGVEKVTAEEEAAKKKASLASKRKGGEGPSEEPPAKKANLGARVPWLEGSRSIVEETPEGTVFQLPLYPDEASVGGFQEFAKLTLVDGLHFPSPGIKEAAVLVTHAAKLLYEASGKETQLGQDRMTADRLLHENEEKLRENQEKIKQLLADKEKMKLLAREQAARLREQEGELAQRAKERSELKRKVESLTSMQPILKKTQDELETEKAAKRALIRELEGARAAVLSAKTEKAEAVKEIAAELTSLKKERATREESLQKESALREFTVQKSLKRAQVELVRLEEQVAQLQSEKTSFEEEVLRAKREGYFKGLEMNFLIFNHYGALDLETYGKAREDPALRASVPAEEYAQQWAHLEEDVEGVDEEIITLESIPSTTPPTVEPTLPILEAIPLTQIPPPTEPNLATIEVVPPVPETSAAEPNLPKPEAVSVTVETPTSEQTPLK